MKLRDAQAETMEDGTAQLRGSSMSGTEILLEQSKCVQESSQCAARLSITCRQWRKKMFTDGGVGPMPTKPIGHTYPDSAF